MIGVICFGISQNIQVRAEQNIRELCFTKGGLLVKEFEEIFSDIFSRSVATHREIIDCLADGPKELMQICKDLGRNQGGRYSKHLNELVKAGFVQRDFAGSTLLRR